MGDFLLLDGPYDGASGPVPLEWIPAPPAIWVYPDPEGKGPFGLCGAKEPRAGATRYTFQQERGSNLYYLYGESIVAPSLLIDEVLAA